MRLRVFVLVALPIFFLPPSSAQQPTPPPKRDPQALRVIEACLAAMGGTSSIMQIQTIQADGNIAPASGTTITPGTFLWKDQITSRGFEFRKEFDSAEGISVLLSGHGKPAQTHKGHTQMLAEHVAEALPPYYAPSIVLSMELANPDYGFTVVGQSLVNGQPTIQLHFGIETDEVKKIIGTQEWYFDPGSGLPVRVEYRIPNTANAANFRQMTADFADFRRVGSLLFPFRMSIFFEQKPQSVVSITSISLNPALADSEFDLTGGVQ